MFWVWFLWHGNCSVNFIGDHDDNIYLGFESASETGISIWVAYSGLREERPGPDKVT